VTPTRTDGAKVHDTAQGPETGHPQTGYYVYGVVRAGDDRVPADLAGVDDAPVHLVAHGEIAAVVAVITVERPPGRRRDLVAYSQVLDALAASGSVVPVQFGSVMSDQDSVVQDLLAPSEEHFTELLDELQGRAQFNLNATYLEPVVLAEVVADDPEIAELRERTRDLPEEAAYGDRVRLGELVARAMEDKRAYDVEVLLAAVLPYAAGHSLRDGAGVSHLLDVALLVDDQWRAEWLPRSRSGARRRTSSTTRRPSVPSSRTSIVEGQRGS